MLASATGGVAMTADPSATAHGRRARDDDRAGRRSPGAAAGTRCGAIDEMQAEARRAPRARPRSPIAIIGMSCRFPGGATSPEAYWELLRAGRDVVTEYPPHAGPMADAAGVDLDRARRRHDLVRRASSTEIDQFDPQFFGISPREAATMDPQQRLRAGGQLGGARARRRRARLARRQRHRRVRRHHRQRLRPARPSSAGPTALDVYSATGGALNAAAGRVAYTLGLQGPCMAIDTACSSSLVALHLACQSLRTGESDLALAGGVNLLLLPGGVRLLRPVGDDGAGRPLQDVRRRRRRLRPRRGLRRASC